MRRCQRLISNIHWPILLHPSKGSEAVTGSDGFVQSMDQLHRCSVVIFALTACVPLHETIDCRRASLQTEYESLIAATQDFPGVEDHNPEPVTAVQFSPTTPPAHLPERSILDKSDGLIRTRIDLPSDQSPDQSFAQPLDVWHAPLSPATLANIKPSDAAADIKTKLAFDLRLSEKLIKIVIPATYFIWPESRAFVQPVAIQFIYNCGLNCSPSAYSGDGLLYMDIETSQVSLRAMQLTSLRDQRFSGRLDFSLNHCEQKLPVRPSSNQSQWFLADLASLMQIMLMRFLGIFRLSD